MKEILKQFFLKIKAKFYNKTEIDTALSGKSDISHNHDDRYFTETEVTNKLAEKSDVGHKHSADDITSGTLPVANGGTGVTTQEDINKAFVGGLPEGTSDVTDGTEFVSSYATDNGFSEPGYVSLPFRRKFSAVWNYIKEKISSVLGLTENTIATLRTNADQGYLCKLYQLAYAIQTYNVILLGKIPDPASTAVEDTGVSWDIDVDFYFIRPTGHKAAWCNVKAGYGYTNDWRKYGLIETFGVDANSNYTNPFGLVTVKYNNEYYIGVRHTCDIDGKYSARVKNVNTNGNGNPSTADGSSLVNMLKVIPYQKTTDGTVLNSEIKSSIVNFPNTYAPAVERNGDLVLKSGYVRVGDSGVAGSKLAIQGLTANSNSYTDTNPKLEFKNDDGSQNISLTFNDFDSVQAPASLTLNGNQGNEYFIAPNIKATTNFIGNLTGNVTGNVSGKSAKSSFLNEYPGAGSTRLTSLNIVPKDTSEFGGMRKDIVTSLVTDGSYPGLDGHLLTMFWDNSGRWDSQFFVACDAPLTLKARFKADGADYGAWIDIITSNNISSQSVSNASTADSLFYTHGNEINFKGGAQGQCWFNYRNADTEGPSPVDTMEYRFCNYSEDTSKSVLIAGSFNGSIVKASSKMVIPIGAPSSLEDGCIWIER